MASRRKKVAKAVPFDAAQVANITKANPYIQRLIEDASLRDNVRTAIDSTKTAYTRLTNGKAPAKALLEDKKLQRNLAEAYEAVREATAALTEGPKKRRKGLTFGRVIFLALTGGGIALAFSEGLRSKVLDTLFGAEEEFQYTPPPSAAAASPTAPATPTTPTTPPVSAA
jgi:hypothetical protein